MADYIDGLRVVHQNGRLPSPQLGYEPELKPVESIENITHKTILVGDSGVGKTSLLVQFDQGKFQAGSFAATVGIGFTVMLLGDSGVGKTCLLVQFKDGTFLSGTFISTVGIDFRLIGCGHAGAPPLWRIKLWTSMARRSNFRSGTPLDKRGFAVSPVVTTGTPMIWDTAGQERFRSVTNAYYRDAHALLLLYDVTNKTSFDNIRAWLTEINEYAQEDVVIMLLGNKADMGGDKIVRREDGERLARDHNVAFMETSAKTGMNVDLAFMAIARDLKMKKTRKPDEPAFNVAEYIQKENTMKVGGCC